MEKKSENAPNAPKIRYYVERQSFWVQAAVILMLLSAAFRLIGCWGLWKEPFFAATQIALPLSCNLLFVLCLLLLGRRFFSATALPVLLGMVFFIVKSFSFDSWVHTVLCILLYLLVAVLYPATVFGVLRTKWLLAPLFGLPFVYHILVEDLPALSSGDLSFLAGMQEMSVLCAMLALLSTVFAMKRKEPPAEKAKGAKAFRKKAEKAPAEEKVPAAEKGPEEKVPVEAEAAPAEEPEKAAPAEPDGAP